MSTDPRPPSGPSEGPHQQQPAPFSVDTSQLSTVYANFCRVTGTPEELVLDFGLNTQMSPIPGEPIRLTHRLVMNFFTAKRLLGALSMALQQHEGVYGVLEVDVQKRARGTAAFRPGGPPQPGSGLGRPGS